MTKNRMRMMRALVLLALAAGSAARADAPGLVSYQGVLMLDSAVVDDGLYSLRFEIYANAVGGAALVGQTLQVQVVDGLYNVILSDPGLAAALHDSNRYMQVTIQPGPGVSSAIALSPRQQITSAPYALLAKEATTTTAEPWRIPTALQNGWTNFGQGWANASYFQDAGKVVHLRGRIQNPGTPAVWTPIFSLPAGYRPTSYTEFPVRASCNPTENLSGSVIVELDGSINLGSVPCSGNIFWLSLDGVTFRAEQ